MLLVLLQGPLHVLLVVVGFDFVDLALLVVIVNIVHAIFCLSDRQGDGTRPQELELDPHVVTIGYHSPFRAFLEVLADVPDSILHRCLQVHVKLLVVGTETPQSS